MKTSLSEVGTAEASLRFSVLRSFALFSALDDEELEDVVEAAVAVRVEAGETLFRQGDPAEHLFLIVSGSIRLSSTTDRDLEQPIALQGPASCFGEMAFLDGEPRSATAIAARPSILLQIGRDELDQALRRHPGAREQFLLAGVRLVSSRLRAANERFWSLAGTSLRAQADGGQSRSRLASLVSHEFRTPLTIIKANAQRLRLALNECEIPIVTKIEQQCGRLEILVDDLIALSLLQSATELRVKPEIDLSDVAAEVVAQASGQARAKGLRLSLRDRRGEVLVSADRTLVRRALRHLVDNAIKFSSAGEILVDASGDAADWCRLRVQDQGIGIEGRTLERLTSSFVQDQDPLNRDVEGLGIGLALAKEVARVHCGRLTAESRPGFGSSFALELPRGSGATSGAAGPWVEEGAFGV